MAKADPSLTALMAEVAELRAMLAAQQQTIARQAAAIAVLQQGAEQAAPMPEQERQPSRARPAEPSGTAPRASMGLATSRRRLLRGAAAATAAATVVSVAVAGAHDAHAAPNASGGSLILGGNNDANATTSLTNTSGSTPGTVFQVSVTGADTSAIAINATSSAATSVSGTDSNGGVGVEGTALGPKGWAVWGSSDTGYGVVGQSGSGIDLTAFGTGRIWQAIQGQAGPPSGAFNIGESIRDSNGELWLCVAAGSPGTWVKVAHTPLGYSGGATSYLSKPIRLLDTRGSDPLAKQNGGGPIAGGNPVGAPYPVTIAGVNWQSVSVPATAIGAIGNVTAVAGAAGGFLAIVPHTAGYSGTATLAYGPNQVVSNSFNTALTGGQLDILIGGGAADVILDLIAVVA